MELPIVTVPNKILRQKAKTVVKLDSRVIELAENMSQTLRTQQDPEGVGLAAPQVGQSLRVIVAKEVLAENTESKIIALINPKIIKKSREQELGWEGCLSIPNQFGQVDRAQKVKVKFLDTNGKKRVVNTGGFLARVLQHEIDHLDGILFTDKVEGKIYSGEELEEVTKQCAI
ncbi:peptide deformylase [Candidatus Parcubacteria bacterium]|nr:peptide deformylase [Candidatus Parcubacteria bacterium]